jgi:rhodanese-related sulfurtransferase
VRELQAKVDAGEDVVILDSRPLGEFEVHSLPGGTSIPGAELVYRSSGVIPSPDSLVVVNCAGRTRSIVGAQTLINAGIPNEVVALEGGTQSWILEGLELEHGRTDAAPPPGPQGVEQARASAQRIAERFGVRTIGRDDLERFRQDDQRSLYLFDVRSPDEYARGHLAGSRSAPSWEVAPWIFRHAATRNARLVLVDDPDLVRATVAASWLIQINWGEVYVLRDALAGSELVVGPEVIEAPRSDTVPGRVEVIDASTLQGRLTDASDEARDIQVVDLDLSTTFRQGHIPGALFAIRSRLPGTIGRIPGSGRIVLTSADGVLARLAAPEVAKLTTRPVAVLDGGTSSWREHGFDIEEGATALLDEPDDVAPSAWQEEDPERQKEGFREYLRWEVGLVDQLRGDKTVAFELSF